MSMSWKNCSSFSVAKIIDWNFFLVSQFACPGHCCALWHQFHRNFSLFDASAWKRIFRSDHTFIFSVCSPSLASPSSFSSYSDAFCVVLCIHILDYAWHDGSHHNERHKPDLENSIREISRFFWDYNCAHAYQHKFL